MAKDFAKSVGESTPEYETVRRFLRWLDDSRLVIARRHHLSGTLVPGYYRDSDDLLEAFEREDQTNAEALAQY